MNTELDRYKKALEIAEWWINSLSRDGEEKKALGEIDMALNPPPEYEEVTIERWSWGGCFATFNTEEDAKRDAVGGAPVVKLTGTLKRLKPQKVEKSVSVEVAIRFDGVIQTECPTPIQPLVQHRECHGKTGVLTFTWSE